MYFIPGLIILQNQVRIKAAEVPFVYRRCIALCHC